jgi:GAF domain-containing protein
MSPPEPDIPKMLAGLADSLNTSDILQTLNDVVEACITHTTATEGGMVLADSNGVLHVVASTSERAADVEEAQLGTSEGPCWDCVHSGDPVEVPDVEQKLDVWPAFSRIAEDRGFRAVHATPMRLRGRTLGSLCLFATSAGALTDREAVLVQTLADAATLSLVQQHALDRSHTLTDQLEHALDSRVIIEQAKGALAQRMGISIDQAFTALRQQARHTGTPLRDIAAEILQPHWEQDVG